LHPFFSQVQIAISRFRQDLTLFLSSHLIEFPRNLALVYLSRVKLILIGWFLILKLIEMLSIVIIFKSSKFKLSRVVICFSLKISSVRVIWFDWQKIWVASLPGIWFRIEGESLQGSLRLIAGSCRWSLRISLHHILESFWTLSLLILSNTLIYYLS
jgi:hypothetical protein